MTSPALFVLFTALVCSIFGIASEPTADHDSRNKMTDPIEIKMGNHWTNKITHKQIYNENFDEIKPKLGVPHKDDIQSKNLDLHRVKLRNSDGGMRNFDSNRNYNVKRRVKREEKERCDNFQLDSANTIMHPHAKNSGNTNYFNNSNCVLKLNATSNNHVITLTFVDMFHIEYHPDCAYDYLEIRDGYYGYADLLGKYCGQTFPKTLTTKGPHVWMKFYSDETIEYEGFKIEVTYNSGNPGYNIPDSCYKSLEGSHGVIKSVDVDPTCFGAATDPLDVLWTITAPSEAHKIFLNFTQYKLKSPNECTENIIQVFESTERELDTKLAEYCGSIANSVTSNTNVIYLRFFASKNAKGTATNFNATFNSFRTVDPKVEDSCNTGEFDCEDSTCIDVALKCDGTANCRLKADEENPDCADEQDSPVSQTHIIVILVIFCLILSGMSFVFLFKCIRKLYQDHNIIKEHIRQSCEDRLDIVSSRLTLDPTKLVRESEPRASLERENHTNEMVKKQRSFSKQKPSSLDSSDFPETQLDLDDGEVWRREVDSVPVEAQDIRLERNGRTRRSDFSKKEESIRSRTKESLDSREKKENRDVSVGAPDTKESGCQTRESLFQTDPPPSSDGSGSNSRGFSTFGYSGATIARRSPPQTNTSEITIELLKQIPPQPETKQLKKIPDRRPISTETTRSAPDVIIVTKPIR